MIFGDLYQLTYDKFESTGNEIWTSLNTIISFFFAKEFIILPLDFFVWKFLLDVQPIAGFTQWRCLDIQQI